MTPVCGGCGYSSYLGGTSSVRWHSTGVGTGHFIIVSDPEREIDQCDICGDNPPVKWVEDSLIIETNTVAYTIALKPIREAFQDKPMFLVVGEVFNDIKKPTEPSEEFVSLKAVFTTDKTLLDYPMLSIQVAKHIIESIKMELAVEVLFASPLLCRLYGDSTASGKQVEVDSDECCPDGKKHLPDMASLSIERDRHDERVAYVDISCARCGQSGTVTKVTSEEEIQW